MTTDRFDSKQIMLVFILVLAALVLARPYIFGHDSDLASHSNMPVINNENKSRAESQIQPTDTHQVKSGESTGSDSLSEIEKLLQ